MGKKSRDLINVSIFSERFINHYHQEVTMKKRTLGIVSGLVALVAGTILCSKPPEPQYSANLYLNPTSQLYSSEETPEPRDSNSDSTGIRAKPQQKSSYQVPITGYKLRHGSQPTETFYVGDAPEKDLFNLFRSDCLGRCIYIRGEDENISKHLVAEDQPEPLLWYDSEWSQTPEGGARFQGDNFWLYVDQYGELKGYGTGLDEKRSAEKLLNQNTE